MMSRWNDKIMRVIYLIGSIVFLFLGGYVLYNGIFFWSEGNFVYENLPVAVRGIMTIFCMVSLGCLFRGSYLLLDKLTKEQHKMVGICLFGLLFILQFLFLFGTKPLLRYDALKVYDEAVSFFYDGGISPDALEGYFVRYTNNYAITFITYILLKLFSFLSLLKEDFSNGIFLLQVVNILVVDCGFYFGHRFVSDFGDKKAGVIYNLFLLLSPLSYVWVPYYYTNTLAMGLSMIGIYMVICLLKRFGSNGYKEKKGTKRQLAVWFFCAFFAFFLLFLSFYIRATIVIAFVALVLYVVMMPKSNISIKSVVLLLAAGILALLCVHGSFAVLEKKYVPFDKKQGAFPAVHWIMMGAAGNGMYDMKDEYYTMSFEDPVERKEADVKLLKERVKQLGGWGLARLYMSKLARTFSDGTGQFNGTELSISDSYSPLHQMVYGKGYEVVRYFAQIMYLTSLMEALIVTVLTLIKRRHLDFFFIMIQVVGAYLFQMIWEAGAIYCIGSMTFMAVLFGFGISLWGEESALKSNDDVYKKRAAKPFLQKISYASGAISVIVLLSTMGYFAVLRSEAENISVNQYLFQSNAYISCTKELVLTQSFQTEKSFDKIGVRIRNFIGEVNDSVYKIGLYSFDDVLIREEVLYGKDVVDFQFKEFAFSSLEGVEEYYLRIEKVQGEHDLTFLYYDTGNYDAYKKGKLYGLKDSSMCDLAFYVKE